MTLTWERLGHEKENGLPTTYGYCLLDLRRRQAQEQEKWKYLGYQIGVDFQTNTPIYLVYADVIKSHLRESFGEIFDERKLDPVVLKLWAGPHIFPYGV